MILAVIFSPDRHRTWGCQAPLPDRDTSGCHVRSLRPAITPHSRFAPPVASEPPFGSIGVQAENPRRLEGILGRNYPYGSALQASAAAKAPPRVALELYNRGVRSTGGGKQARSRTRGRSLGLPSCHHACNTP